MHACHPISLFFHYSSFFFLFSLFFSQSLLMCCDSLLEAPIVVLMIPHCAQQRSFIYYLPLLTFTILAFNYSCLVWVSLSTITGLSAIQPPPLTCAGHATPITRQRRLFCLLAHRGILTCYPYLVIPTHPYFF